jgi:O-antigen/teichoic acid export membrane protein
MFILTILVNFSVIPIYLNFMSLDEFGLVVTIQGVIVLLSLTDLGMSAFATQKLSDKEFFNSYNAIVFIDTVQLFQYLLGAIMGLMGFLFYCFFEDIISVNDEYLKSAKTYFIFAWAGVVLRVFYSVNNSILASQHHLSFINFLSGMYFILATIFNVFFLNIGYGIEMFGASFLLSSLFILIILVLKVYNETQVVTIIPTKFNWDYVRNGFSYTLKFQLLKISHISKMNLFTVLLNNFAGQVIVAKYNITNKIPQLIPGFYSKIVLNLFPSMSSWFSSGDPAKFTIYYKRIFIISLELTVYMVMGVYYLNYSFIDLWVGADKFIDYSVFYIIVINMFMMLVTSFTGLVIQSSGKFSKLPVISVLEVLFFVILSTILFKLYGVFGFFVGYILSILPAFLYSMFLVSEILNTNLFFWVFESFKGSVLVVAIGGGLFEVYSGFFVNSLYGFISVIILYALIVIYKLYRSYKESESDDVLQSC